MGEGQSAILQLKQYKQFTPNHPQHHQSKIPFIIMHLIKLS